MTTKPYLTAAEILKKYTSASRKTFRDLYGRRAVFKKKVFGIMCDQGCCFTPITKTEELKLRFMNPAYTGPEVEIAESIVTGFGCQFQPARSLLAAFRKELQQGIKTL